MPTLTPNRYSSEIQTEAGTSRITLRPVDRGWEATLVIKTTWSPTAEEALEDLMGLAKDCASGVNVVPIGPKRET
jgi:hypothetical protein